MAFSLEEFIAVRPYLYHLTAATNLNRIASKRMLLPASMFIRDSERTDLIDVRRTEHQLLRSADGHVEIRDQIPLTARNIEFSDGFTLSRLVDLINQHVFFWPGWDSKPIPAGVNHFQRYEQERPRILRISTSAVLAHNPEIVPLFCQYNSGAPRCSGGRRSPRGPRLYLESPLFEGTASRVVEFVVRGPVGLPDSTEVSPSPMGTWGPLWI